MDLIRGSLNNPIARFMSAIAIILLGLIAFSKLSVDLFPDITYPIVSVVTEYKGASPEDVEISISRPIEKIVSRIQNVKSVQSRSREGLSIIQVEFNWGTNLDTSATDIQNGVNQILSNLPKDADQPIIIKFDPSQISVITLALAGSMDEWKLRELAEDGIAPRIESLPGVAAANVFGGEIREIQVEAFRPRLEASGLALEHVIDAVKTSNVDLPGGSLKAGVRDYTVRTIGKPLEVSRLEDFVVTTRNGSAIRLRDIARVRDGFEEQETSIHVNASKGLIIGVQKQSGGNTVAVVDAVRNEIPRIRRDLPPGVSIEVVNDQSTFIRKSIKNLQHEAIIGAILATLIILLFLRNFTSTVIIAHSIPISIIATFVLLHFNKLSLNIMTLGGLALGVGRLVDDAIVVLENINRHLDRGEPPLEASYKGAREVSRAVIAATVTSIIVFLPLAFIQGIAAILFLQMAYTVAFSLMASLFDSLTLVPVLTAKFLKPESQRRQRHPTVQRLFESTQRMFDRMDGRYQATLQWALGHRTAVLGGVTAIFAGSLLFIPLIGTEFFPKSDEGQLRINFRLPVGTRIEETMRTMEQIEQLVIADVPELRAMYARAGSGKGRGVIWSGRHAGPHTGFISASLVDKADRSRSPDQIARALRPKFSRIPGTVVAINPGGLVSRLITFGAEEPIDIEIQGHDLATANRVAREMADWLRGVRGVADVQVSREEGLPELRAYIQHHRVAALGLTVSRVADTVKAALQGIEASIFIDPSTGREHKIRVRLREEDRQRVDDLRLINLPMKNGHPVPLSSVAELVHTASPTQIERKYQRRIVHITADTSGRDLGSIAQEIEQYLASYTVPKDFSVNLGGARQEQQDAFRNLALALGLAVVLVYMVLASQYRSLLHPLVVMFSVPLGVTGVIWALLLTETTLSVISFIGVIMMVGIVVSNAILLVDYTNVLREEHGLPLHQAVVTAGRTRLRPILMTTLTTILALSPLAMGIGEGSEANQPMAIAVIGGLAVSTFLTLVFVPTLYTTLEERVRRGRPGPAGSPSADAPQP